MQFLCLRPSLFLVSPPSSPQSASLHILAGNVSGDPTASASFARCAAQPTRILAEYDWKRLASASQLSPSSRPRGFWQSALVLLLFVFLLAAPQAQAQAQAPTSGYVSVPSMILAVAGGGTTVPSTTAGPGTGAKLKDSASVATDSAGNVYIADPAANVIEKLDVAGNITVIAGGGSTVPSTTPMSATSAKLNQPYGVATDSAGNVYIADSSNTLLEKLNPSTNQIVVIAGGGSTPPSTRPEPAANASIGPFSVVVDDAGNVYIADGNNLTIDKLDTVWLPAWRSMPPEISTLQKIATVSRA